MLSGIINNQIAIFCTKKSKQEIQYSFVSVVC